MLESKKITQTKSEIKRNQLVKASLSLFHSKGFHDCRIEDIAAKAGVGKGTFYLYFKNKEDLVDRLLNEFMDEIRLTLSWVMDNVEDDADLTEIFKEEGRRLVQSMEKNKKFSQFFFREGRSVSPMINKKIINFTHEIVELSENTFAMAMAAKMIPIQNPKICAVSVFGSINHMYEYWLNGGFKMDGLTVEQLTEHCVSFFVRALGVEE